MPDGNDVAVTVLCGAFLCLLFMGFGPHSSLPGHPCPGFTVHVCVNQCAQVCIKSLVT